LPDIRQIVARDRQLDLTAANLSGDPDDQPVDAGEPFFYCSLGD